MMLTSIENQPRFSFPFILIIIYFLLYFKKNISKNDKKQKQISFYHKSNSLFFMLYCFQINSRRKKWEFLISLKNSRIFDSSLVLFYNEITYYLRR